MSAMSDIKWKTQIEDGACVQLGENEMPGSSRSTKRRQEADDVDRRERQDRKNRFMTLSYRQGKNQESLVRKTPNEAMEP